MEELVLERMELVSDDLGDPIVLRVKLPTLASPLTGLSAMRRLEDAELEIPPSLWSDCRVWLRRPFAGYASSARAPRHRRQCPTRSGN